MMYSDECPEHGKDWLSHIDIINKGNSTFLINRCTKFRCNKIIKTSISEKELIELHNKLVKHNGDCFGIVKIIDGRKVFISNNEMNKEA